MEIENNIKIAKMLGHLASLRDYDTGTHNLRVAYISSLFGQSIKLDNKTLQGVMKGAFLHDIGKIAIPDKILLKSSSLDKQEWTIMKEHPNFGKEILDELNLPWFSDAIPIVLHHHEKYDGSGYPDGLKGEEIDIKARVFAIIDVFDALVVTRPYKKPFSLEKSFNIIKEGSNIHFESKIVNKFLPLIKDFYKIVTKESESNLRAKLEENRKRIFNA